MSGNEQTSFQRDYQSLVTEGCGEETQLLTPKTAPEQRDLGRSRWHDIHFYKKANKTSIRIQ